jgi:hypothetical protein
VVDVTDGADVDVRLRALELLLGNCLFPPKNDSNYRTKIDYPSDCVDTIDSAIDAGTSS